MGPIKILLKTKLVLNHFIYLDGKLQVLGIYNIFFLRESALKSFKFSSESK